MATAALAEAVALTAQRMMGNGWRRAHRRDR
jgi:hypothetical protein